MKRDTCKQNLQRLLELQAYQTHTAEPINTKPKNRSKLKWQNRAIQRLSKPKLEGAGVLLRLASVGSLISIIIVLAVLLPVLGQSSTETVSDSNVIVSTQASTSATEDFEDLKSSSIFDKLASAFEQVIGGKTSTKSLAIQNLTTTSTFTSTPTSATTTTQNPIETTSTLEHTTTTSPEAEEQPQDDTSSGNDADAAPDCSGLSVGQSAEGKNLTDNERFLNLQTCLQRKIQIRLKEARRSGLEAFETLKLSGGCSSSLLSLMTGLGELKSFAFKFMDASAKVPSGVMYGLLSDFGDFDQCVSIRSNPNIDWEQEAEEGAFSGKYCLIGLRLNYRVHLEPNQSTLAGVITDGLLWDEMIRNYWLSKTPKPFQMGVCVPSRCNLDDLVQIVAMVSENYNMISEIQSCQDGQDIRQQHKADLLQRVILFAFALLIAMTILGTIVDRYQLDNLVARRKEVNEATTHSSHHQQRHYMSSDDSAISNPSVEHTSHKSWFELVTCFSIARNWRVFIRKHPSSRESSLACNWTCLPSSSILVSSTADSSTANLSLNPAEIDCEKTDVLKSDVPTSFEQTQSKVGGNLIEDSIDDRSADCLTARHDSKLNQLTIRIHGDDQFWVPKQRVSLSHLSGLRLFVIVWITMGQSFLYPSANNYQYYRSIINMNLTRNSVWFTTTNYTLGIDMLLYMAGLVFVYKLARLKMPTNMSTSKHRVELNSFGVLSLISKKILRFWPTYVSLIAIAIISPLLSDGPMWPEMVNKRLGSACRQNWWSNLLFVNNMFEEQNICLPSSWFVSILMQLFVIGSLIIVLVHKFSLRVAIVAIVCLLVISCGFSFAFAFVLNLPAPVIRMDESFVMTIDGNIFRLYTNTLNNLGPFLVGMLGGMLLVKSSLASKLGCNTICSPSDARATNSKAGGNGQSPKCHRIHSYIRSFPYWPIFLIITVLVLTSVLHQSYTRLWSALYWSLHRVLWAVSTGFLIHQCATYKWRLLHDFLSLSSFIPLSRLIFITYLIFPMFIHMHTGLVRDGLHVTIYNMMNIYVTRLVMAFGAALFIHLLVELPFCSVEEILLNRWLRRISRSSETKDTNTFHPLLAVAPIIAVQYPVEKSKSPNI